MGYARVSTTEQNLDMQITALKKYGVNEWVKDFKRKASETHQGIGG
ncbi:recombinase family protein [Pseudophaeobacter sp.]